ncbi:hypothetical protein COCMIDRAFT_95544 [Bipolaris oryzae ATCC 44560]|uniref:RapZ C-terminal domain-containing protein n=1 Tax=Bipolaris oryzae ATCC 44560 TaxID=930090 RepID=W6Z638_COCMI|nr:uncharacterized protein COCMIDRAFT_95544 [Bipolaris oryzae ATCC 44560]EUC45445.1 hypothetical protein COCMIDRAFT_95544 [Bipolaris oryzae ATCC 44560]
MTIISDIASKVKSIRLVPPTEEEISSSKRNLDSSKQSQPEPKRPVLEITSYDRFTPLSPTPDLEYDCRITNNPSEELRKTCTGLDAVLQEELMSRSSFSNMVTQAESDIRRLMEVEDVRTLRSGETAIVRVGCLCGSGHHRSVAFAEKLGQVQWCEQGEWEVRVSHRNLTSGVEETKRIRGEKSKRKENKDTEKGGYS